MSHWKLQHDASGAYWQYDTPYPGTQIEMRQVLRDEDAWSAWLTNIQTGKQIALESFGTRAKVKREVEQKVTDPFAPFYNEKLRKIGIVPHVSFDALHKQGADHYKETWLSANLVISEVAQDYGLDTFAHREMLSAIAWRVCRLLAEPVGEPSEL